MQNVSKWMILGLLTLSPLPALAADNTGADSPAANAYAAGGQHGKGFEDYWKRLDPNGTGFITEDAYLADAQKHAKQRFAEMDTNGDGKVSKAEMQAYHEKKQSERRAHYQEMKAKYQAKDHQVTQ